MPSTTRLARTAALLLVLLPALALLRRRRTAVPPESHLADGLLPVGLGWQ